MFVGRDQRKNQLLITGGVMYIPCKKSYVLADLYDSPHNRIEKNMYIDITKDILEYYGGSRITQKRVDEINKLLHNAWIDYRYDNGSDEDYLDGNLSDYITQ